MPGLGGIIICMGALVNVKFAGLLGFSFAVYGNGEDEAMSLK